MVGRCIPYWNSPFSGDMFVFRGVYTKMNIDVQVMLVSLIWVHIPTDQLAIRHLAMSGFLASLKPYQNFEVQHTRYTPED